MPTDAEVRDAAKLARLRLLLRPDLRHLVAFSDPAATAVGLVGREPVFRAPHPGLQLINRRYLATGVTRKRRAEERCRLFARDVLGLRDQVNPIGSLARLASAMGRRLLSVATTIRIAV